MAFEFVLYEVKGGVATITINRPERFNALNAALRQELLDAIGLSEERNDVRAVVITGAGRSFCPGGDVKALKDAVDAEATNPLSQRLAPIRDKIVLAIRNSGKPFIAAVNGPAAGGGMNLALACDIRIASTAAKFGQSFVRRGMHPDWGGTYFLPRLVGLAKACELIWSGKAVDADEALSLGIVSQVVEPNDLMPTVLEMASEFAAGPPVAIRLAKRAIYRAMETGLREALEFETYAQNICLETDDFKEGVRAFVEKREPTFSGR